MRLYMPKTFYIIWFSNRLTLSVAEEAYYRIVALSLHRFGVHIFISLITVFVFVFIYQFFFIIFFFVTKQCVLYIPLLNAVDREMFII